MVFFLIATSILGVMYAYVGWRLLEPWQLSSGVKWAAWGVLGVHLAVVIASFALMRLTGSAAIARALWWVGFVGLGVLSLLFAGLLVRDLGWAGLGLVDWVLPGERRILPVDPDRRRFLLGAFNMALLGLTGAASAVGVWGAQHIPRVKEVVVPILGLPEALEGYRIVQITDLHVGPTIREDYVAGVVSAIAKLDADLIAVTGDMVDGSPEDLEPLMQPLAQLRARDGVFFCTGNHEYYSGVLRWCAAMSRLGMKVLNNAHAVVTRQGARILVAGVTDHRAHTMVPSHR